MQLSSRKDPRIQQFKDRLNAFVPHIMFDTTFDAEQKLQAFAIGFGAYGAIAEVLVNVDHTLVQVAVRFDEQRADFVFFYVKIAHVGLEMKVTNHD